MVVGEKFKDAEASRCEESGFDYREPKIAEKCEQPCQKRGTWNTEIAGKALERPG